MVAKFYRAKSSRPLYISYLKGSKCLIRQYSPFEGHKNGFELYKLRRLHQKVSWIQGFFSAEKEIYLNTSPVIAP